MSSAGGIDVQCGPARPGSTGSSSAPDSRQIASPAGRRHGRPPDRPVPRGVPQRQPGEERSSSGWSTRCPDPRYPFLGVHFTRRVYGELDVGPNAVLSLKREGYRRRDFEAADVREILAWPGFWQMARTHWRTGAKEVYGSLSIRAYMRLRGGTSCHRAGRRRPQRHGRPGTGRRA